MFYISVFSGLLEANNGKNSQYEPRIDKPRRYCDYFKYTETLNSFDS